MLIPGKILAHFRPTNFLPHTDSDNSILLVLLLALLSVSLTLFFVWMMLRATLSRNKLHNNKRKVSQHVPALINGWFVIFALFSVLPLDQLATQRITYASASANNSIITDRKFRGDENFLENEIQHFLDQQTGPLKTYREVLPDGKTQSAARTIAGFSLISGLNPKVTLILLELKSQLLSTNNTAALNSPFQFTKPDQQGFDNQLELATHFLGETWLDENSSNTIRFKDGSSQPASSSINKATFALQVFLALGSDPVSWEKQVGLGNGSFYQLYTRYFGDPLASSPQRNPQASQQGPAPFLRRPFADGDAHNPGLANGYSAADGLYYNDPPDQGINTFFDHIHPGTNYFVGQYEIAYRGVQTPHNTRAYPGHDGIDFNTGTRNVLAAASGYVRSVSFSNNCGGNIYINHPDNGGYITLYQHLLSLPNFTQGQYIAEGTLLGQSGYKDPNNSCTAGGHLHFGVYEPQFIKPVDPFGFCPASVPSDPWSVPSYWLWKNYTSPCQQQNQNQLADGNTIKGSAMFVYAYYKGTKFYIPDPATATASGYDLTKTKTLDDATVASFPTATAPDATSSKPDNRADGTLVAVQNVTGVFAIYGGALFGVPDPNTLTSSYGSDAWSKVIYLPGPMFNTLHTNTNGIILRSPSSGSYYLVQNGQKRLFPNPDTITYYGLSINDAHTMPDPMLYSLPNGDAMPGAGSLDRATCAGISGWTWDPKAPNTSITYHLYKDGQFGVGTFVGAYPADQYRADLVSITKDNAKHGFSIPIPDSLLDGQNHSIYVYAINTVYNQINPLLQGSGITIKCAYRVGQGSNYPSNFIDVFYSGGATDRFGNPTDIVRNWSSSGVKYQPMSGGTATNPRLWHDEGGGSDPANIRAFVTYGPIGDYYLNLGGPSSWLGAPTSNYYTNTGGQTQKSFAGGYLLLNGNTIEPHPWPTTSSTWKTTYYNNPGLMSGPTYVSDEGSANTLDIAHNDWLPDTPIAPSVGLSFNDNWSVKWERNWTFGAGSYRFHLCGDDGIRLYLGGAKVIDQWHWQNLSCYDYYQTYSTSVTLPIKIEYFQLNGSAAMSFSVTQVPELIVTNPLDTGDINAPNTLSWALAAWDTGKVIRFNTNNISVRGSLPPVKKGTQLLGSCSNQVVIDGSYPGAPLDGLSLNGNAYILGVKLQKFKGKLVKLNNSRGNTFVCSSLVQ